MRLLPVLPHPPPPLLTVKLLDSDQGTSLEPAIALVVAEAKKAFRMK